VAFPLIMTEVLVYFTSLICIYCRKAGRFEFRTPAGGKRFSLHHKRPPRPWGLPSYLHNVQLGFFQGIKWPSLTTYHNLPPVLGMSRALHLLTLCAFTVGYGANFRFDVFSGSLFGNGKCCVIMILGVELLCLLPGLFCCWFGLVLGS
jgi:hypothetical protein